MCTCSIGAGIGVRLLRVEVAVLEVSVEDCNITASNILLK